MLRQMDKQAQIANLREIYADVMDYGDLEQEKEKLEAERDGVSERYQKEIEQNARVAQDQGEYQKRADELAAEYNRLDAEVKAVEAGSRSVNSAVGGLRRWSPLWKMRERTSR